MISSQDNYKSLYRIALVGGPLDGLAYIPDIKHFWFFQVKIGKFGSGWVSYHLVSQNKQPKSMKELIKSKKQEITKKAFGLSKGSAKAVSRKKHDGIEPQAVFQFCRAFDVKPEDHCDVQTFIRWHEQEFQCRPDTIRTYN